MEDKNNRNETAKMCFSPAGNRTPVARVTGGNTHHYTTEEVFITIDEVEKIHAL